MARRQKKQVDAEKNMTLSGHLRELRNRIVACVICLVVAFLAGLTYSQKIIDLLMGMSEGYTFVYIAPQELLMERFSIALIVGICITMPVILYNIWAFVQPGLKKNENALFLSAMVFGLICFVIGVFFAYKIMLPFMLDFLIGISAGTEIVSNISIQSYVSFVLTIFIIFGVVFEFPVVAVLLTQMGLLKVEWMKKGRKVVIVLIFLIAAFITPPDVVSQIMVAIPMIALYEISILLSSVLMKLKRKKKKDDDDDDDDKDEDSSNDD